MRITWKRFEPKETNHELLWLGVSAVGLVVSALWLSLKLPWPSCAFHNWTGFPCLTCGATRSTIQFFHGDFQAAWHWNPLVFLGLCAVVVYNTYAGAVLIMHTPRLRPRFSSFEKQALRIGLVCLLALNWLHSLGHWRDF
jgi:hypothetical protein